MRTFQLFRRTFFLGLSPGVVILLFQLQHLMPWLLYIGTVQIGLLTLLSYRLEGHIAPLAIETLHKAGFLHTLLAVGAAVVVSGKILASGALTAESVSRLLFPMGAALLPHALGVAAGHTLQMRRDSAMGESAAETEALRKLYRQREELLKQVVEAQQEELRLHQEVQTQLKQQIDLLREVGETLKGIEKPIHDALETVQRTLSMLKTTANGLKSELEGTREAAKKTCSALEEGATAAKKTVAFLKDAEKLHHAIVKMLESDLFRKAA